MKPVGRVGWPVLLLLGSQLSGHAEIHLRLNQAGYRPHDAKVVIAFSDTPIEGKFDVVDLAADRPVHRGRPRPTAMPRWGRWTHHVELDFTRVRKPGRYFLRLGAARSSTFPIDDRAFAGLPDHLLEFMRQQRCGDNPWLGAACHRLDGRTAYGPSPAGTPLDVRGGWHDAADLLKYLLTSANATAQMLLAHRISPAIFGDTVNELGQSGANGQADVLDEARWGIEWMLRLHPAPDHLYHQVADDRDHWGWRLPADEQADYGWGKGGARVVYFADGRPQGLGKYASESTGVANLAGRYAAAMSMARLTWKDHPHLAALARRCLVAGREVYELGRRQEGVQQGNSYSAPYRYGETTWADDMEWGAAELYRATRERRYLDEACRYARLAAATSWMGRETARHYEFYPFLNLGHYALHDQVEPGFRKALAGYYREGIERCVRASHRTPYRLGVPFIWCSNNLTVALATQGLLYERMTGETRYRRFTAAQGDWLLGRNPWGYSMFTGIPEAGRHPRQPHLMTTRLTGRPVRGGLVDGPVAADVFRSLKGVSITRPDPLGEFQSEGAVYHDDLMDYSTNEPTMDGTASAILWFALLAR